MTDHFLLMTATPHDAVGIFRAGALSQRPCNLPLYFVTNPDAEVIAFVAFFNSFSIRSRSANVRRTSFAITAFFSKKSNP